MDIEAQIEALFAQIDAMLLVAEGREGGALTGEELKSMDEMQTKVEALEKQLEMQKASVARKAAALAPAAGAKSAQPGSAAGDGTGDILDAEGDKYADVYKDDFGQFALDVRLTHSAIQGSASPRLQKYLNLYETEAAKLHAAAPTQVHEVVGTDEGGFMVPPDHRDLIWEVIMAEEGLFAMSNPEPTVKNQVSFAADESTAWSADGIQAHWAGENTLFDPSKLATQGRLVRLEKIYAFVNASDEMLEDAPRLTNRLTRKAPEAIRFKVDEAMVNGNGSGKPLGWTVSGAMITVAKESGQAADTIVAENIAKMYQRQFPEALLGSMWFCNQDVFSELTNMTLGGRIVYTSPQTGIVGAPAGTLFGLPIRFSQHAKTLGDFGDIQLVNLNRGYYSTNKAGGIKFATSIHLYFDYDVMSFRWTVRVGGRPYLSAPIAPQFGSNTNSHFIGLAARA